MGVLLRFGQWELCYFVRFGPALKHVTTPLLAVLAEACQHSLPQLDAHAGGSASSLAVNTCSMNATSSAQLAKCVAWPDTTCSTRPRGTSGSPGAATATCTTKARWAGNRDCDPLCVCTCLAPLRCAMSHAPGAEEASSTGWPKSSESSKIS